MSTRTQLRSTHIMNTLLRPTLLLCALAISSASGCKQKTSATSQPPNADPEDRELYEVEAPKRISRDHRRQEDLEIPALPSNAEQLPEITVELNAPNGEKRIVSRSRNRVHLAMPDRNQEWLFVRNPVDGRRVTGILIDHGHKVLLDYPETDLRVEGVARGWADVIAIDESQGKVTAGINAKLIADPAQRFPDYGDFDIADWREELHENGHDHAGHQPANAGHPAGRSGPHQGHGH